MTDLHDNEYDYEYEDSEEWRPGECDNCYGGDENGVTATGPLGPLYCACFIGQGADPEDDATAGRRPRWTPRRLSASARSNATPDPPPGCATAAHPGTAQPTHPRGPTMDFRDALNIVTAELTPRAWEYATGDGTTLTVIPDGQPADPGDAEVLIQITAGKTLAAQIGVTTTDLPALIDALTERRPWECSTVLDSLIDVTFPDGGSVLLVVTETVWEERDNHAVPTSILLAAEQRLPLASALRRALDVARGWED